MTDNSKLLTREERQAIAERAARIAEMSTEDDCEYVESVLQLADSDIPRLLRHIEALELALEQRWNQWQTAEGRAEAANERIEALNAGLTRIAAGKMWRYITDVCVCQWCGQPGEEGNIEHFACCPSVIAKKAREGGK